MGPSARHNLGIGRYCFRSQITTSCSTSLFCCDIQMRFISLWRSFTGRNPRPEMNRRGLRISRSLADQHKIDKPAVNGCCEYPQSRIHINGFLVDFDEGVAESIDMSDGRNVVHEVFYTQDPANAFEVEATLQIGTIYRY